MLASRGAFAEDGKFVPTARTDLPALVAIVSKGAPALQQDRLGVDLARSDAKQSRLYENPTLDATWGTIPIGRTNPPDLADPMLNVPNYTIGISYRFLLGKRTSRHARADALIRAAEASLDTSARDNAINLARLLGSLAADEVRLDALQGVLEQAKAAVVLAKSRETAGIGTPLDTDRLSIEQARVEQSIRTTEADRDAMLAACPTLTGQTCATFSGGAEARGFLGAWIRQAAKAEGSIEERPDIRVLDATREAAGHESKLAQAQKIPDLTLRLGYTHDRFVVSGNQQNSLSLTLSIPLPLFDAGEAARTSADARSARAELQRKQVLDADSARLVTLRSTLARQERRHVALVTETIPKAKAVVDDLDRAATPHLIPLTDLIQARRSLSELAEDEADSMSEQFSTAITILSLLPERSGAFSP